MAVREAARTTAARSRTAVTIRIKIRVYFVRPVRKVQRGLQVPEVPREKRSVYLVMQIG